MLFTFIFLPFYFFTFLPFYLSLNPFTCVHEGLDPRSHLILTAVCGIPGVLPGEDGSLEVRHHTEMTTVG
jgi:hypothetical protein